MPPNHRLESPGGTRWLNFLVEFMFWDPTPEKQGRNSNQNLVDHLGSRCVYIYNIYIIYIYILYIYIYCTWRIILGLGYVVNNHGDRFRPLRIGLFPCQMALFRLFNW